MRLNSKLYKALETNDAQTIKAAYLEYVKILEARRAKKDELAQFFNEQLKMKWRKKQIQQHIANRH
jgi:hypothetical protein